MPIDEEVHSTINIAREYAYTLGVVVYPGADLGDSYFQRRLFCQLERTECSRRKQSLAGDAKQPTAAPELNEQIRRRSG